jgi:branched-chain amino acid transport system ATP-binding protein
VLKLEEVTVRYGAVTALRDVSITVEEGELVTLIGANGAGKTTTLKAISGMLPLAGGRITFAGRKIDGASPRQILALGIAHCPEGRRVFPQLTVRENLEMGAFLRYDHAAVRSDMERIFVRLPRLRERVAQVAGTLSGGEQQMLAIARSLMSRPRMILLDEPSLGLAPNITEIIFEIIDDIRRDGATVLMVEQNALAALDMCDRSYLLETGRVVQFGTGEQMLGDAHVRRAYLGG